MGIAALRYDHAGTGDATGTSRNGVGLGDWLDGVAQATGHLRRLGAKSVSAVGMRFGAALVCGAAGDLGLDGLVLWDPVPSGRKYLRELQVLGEAALARAPGLIRPVGWVGQEPADSGEEDRRRRTLLSIEAVGVYLSPALYDEMARFSTVPEVTGPPTLVVHRADRPTGPLEDRLGAWPGNTWVDVHDQSTLLDVESLLALVPTETLQVICAWLSEHLPESDDNVIDVAALERATEIPSAAGLLQEEACSIGPLGLFGIRTYAAKPSALPLIVCLNNSVDHHVGPGRLWVDWARDLAGRGFSTLRLDLSGLGDSPARPGQPIDRPFPAEANSDLHDVISALVPDNGVVLVGYCSGGRNSLNASNLTGVKGIVAVNTALHTPSSVERLISPTVPISKALRKINTDRRISRAVRQRLPGLFWRTRSRLGIGTDMEKDLTTLAREPIEILIAYGRDDYHLWKAKLGMGNLLERLAITPTFRFAVVDDLDHGLFLDASQQRLLSVIDDYLDGVFLRKVSDDTIS
jgi:pimeloyl-ACP methyl ester carboxylesterase